MVYNNQAQDRKKGRSHLSFWQYALTRLAMTLPMILILVSVVFLILRIMPGDVCTVVYGGRGRPEELERCREKLGFNKSLPAQYVDYIAGIARLDFGISLRTNQPVLQEILRRVPATLELAIFAMLVASLLGLLTGISSATHNDRSLDHGFRIFNIAAFAMPIFWLGLLLQILFAVHLKLFPVGGRLDPVNEIAFTPITGFYVLDALLQGDLSLLLKALQHLTLPAITLGMVLSGVIGRISRANMLEVLDKDYIKTARSKGLREGRVIYRHALRNTLIPIVTVIGLQFALLLGGAILTETVFNWPGLAQYLLRAINARDYLAIQGTVVFIALFISTVNLVVDILYSRLDPRVRY